MIKIPTDVVIIPLADAISLNRRAPSNGDVLRGVIYSQTGHYIMSYGDATNALKEIERN